MPSLRDSQSDHFLALRVAEFALGGNVSLQAEDIGMNLSAIVHDEIGSTQDEALRLAQAGAEGPILIQAFRQTAGRGRQGRTWHSPGGGVHATLLLTEPLLAIQRAWLPLLSCFAWIDLLEPQRGPHVLQLKWPNDLYLNGRKAGGQLVDLHKSPAGRAIALVGSGLNVRAPLPPPEVLAEGGLANEATSLAAEGIDPGMTLEELARAWAERLLNFLGMAKAANATRNLIAHGEPLLWARGCRVAVRQGALEPWTGTVLGLAPGAALRLRADDGEERLVHDATLRLAASPIP